MLSVYVGENWTKYIHPDLPMHIYGRLKIIQLEYCGLIICPLWNTLDLLYYCTNIVQQSRHMSRINFSQTREKHVDSNFWSIFPNSDEEYPIGMSKWEKPQQMENRYRPYLCVLIPLFVLHTSRETQNQTGRKTNYTYTTTVTHYTAWQEFSSDMHSCCAHGCHCVGAGHGAARLEWATNTWRDFDTLAIAENYTLRHSVGYFFLSSVNFLRTVVVHWAAKGTKVERMRREDFLIFRMTHNLHGANGKIKW